MQQTNINIICNNNIKMSQSFQSQLILAKLPYPKHYNGQQWNTIVNKSRSNIPSYLREDLPPLKFQYIRQQFKKINMLACPRLTYFNNHIQKSKAQKIQHHSNHHRLKDTSSEEGFKTQRKSTKKGDFSSKKSKLRGIRQAMQYSLVTTNRNSKEVIGLLEQANNIEDEINLQNIPKRRFKASSLRKVKRPQGCFEDTIGIVLALRRQTYLKDQQKQREEARLKNQEIQIKTAKLISFENEQNG